MNEVDRWLSEGAGVREGLRLLSQYPHSLRLERLVSASPERYGYLLVHALEKYASPVRSSAKSASLKEISGASGKKFREDWPFLSEPGCPPELKILAADKITTWQNYRDLHESLFSCESPEDCFETAKKLLKNFSENRQIIAEFTFYKTHGRPLGKHPVFKQVMKRDKYRSMSAVQLVKEEARLKASIWRDESEIKKGNKPRLDDARKERISAKRSELIYIQGLIAEYNKPKR